MTPGGFGWGIWRISVYGDRVQLGSLLDAYPLSDIASAEVKSILGQYSVFLVLRKGKKTLDVAQNKANAMKCKEVIERALKNFNELSANANVVMAFTVLGGTATPFVAGDHCMVVFAKETVRLTGKSKEVEVRLDAVTLLKLSGPGQVTSDAGFVGGGFGIEGAAIGIGAAAILNSLTETSTTNSILHLAWPSAELFLHTSRNTPDEIRLILSHAFTVVESRSNTDGAAGLAEQLGRIAALRDSGHLTLDEFALAKAKLLGQ